MSFTEEELRSFNSILEQRLSAHRSEVERMLDQRLHTLRREFDQRLIAVQQEIIRALVQKHAEQQSMLNHVMNQKFSLQQSDVTRLVGKELERKQVHLSELVDQTMATQLLSIEQLLNQYFSTQEGDGAALSPEQASRFETIEVQTDLPWDELLDMFSKALDERFATLKESMQAAIKDEEVHLSARFHALLSQIRHEYTPVQPQPYLGNLTTLQEVFNSIEQLERIIESMQIAMTNGHALLANRLYHHQQLSLERAHPAQQPAPSAVQPSNGMNSQKS